MKTITLYTKTPFNTFVKSSGMFDEKTKIAFLDKCGMNVYGDLCDTFRKIKNVDGNTSMIIFKEIN